MHRIKIQHIFDLHRPQANSRSFFFFGGYVHIQDQGHYKN